MGTHFSDITSPSTRQPLKPKATAGCCSVPDSRLGLPRPPYDKTVMSNFRFEVEKKLEFFSALQRKATLVIPVTTHLEITQDESELVDFHSTLAVFKDLPLMCCFAHQVRLGDEDQVWFSMKVGKSSAIHLMSWTGQPDGDQPSGPPTKVRIALRERVIPMSTNLRVSDYEYQCQFESQRSFEGTTFDVWAAVPDEKIASRKSLEEALDEAERFIEAWADSPKLVRVEVAVKGPKNGLSEVLPILVYRKINKTAWKCTELVPQSHLGYKILQMQTRLGWS